MLRGLHISIAFWAAVLSVVGAAQASELTSAWEDVGFLDYRRAFPQFERVQKIAAPQSPEWQQATLGMALCLHQRQPDVKAHKERAAELYDALVAASDEAPIQATALLLRGKLDQLVDYFGDEENFAGAARSYERILRDWPESSSAGEAALYLAQTAIYTMDKDATRKGMAQLEAWVKAHPDTPYAASHWLLIALGHRMPLEDQGAAVDASLNALKAGLPKEMKVDLLYWRIATMAQNAGKLAVARDFYTRIIVEVQRSSYTYMAQERIREMGFEAPELIDPFEH
ncbi:MAG: hypothetical protein ISS31_07790 [Kiritimatiellae bacterium]|nr:hypothetical protein [Kiritimatiellia bacterium]